LESSEIFSKLEQQKKIIIYQLNLEHGINFWMGKKKRRRRDEVGGTKKKRNGKRQE